MIRSRLWLAVTASLALVVLVGLLGVGDSQAHGKATAFKLAVAGDIACPPGETGVPPTGRANGPDNCQQAVTAALVESLKPNGVAIPGDIQYEQGSLTEFLASFDKTWGSLKQIIYPAPGNHEWYDTPNGQGYFDYFDGIGRNTGRAGNRGQGYYSVNLNRYWHLITLNSNCTADNTLINAPVACNHGSAQERWLRSDLAAHRGQCVIAQWHHPLFTSGPNQGSANDLATASFWRDLYSARATLVLNGHDHGYERFARQSPSGKADPSFGLREFVLGTGGKSLFGPGPKKAPNSQSYNNTAYGITLFTLLPHSYQWRFYPAVSADNGNFSDHGSAPCNRRRVA